MELVRKTIPHYDLILDNVAVYEENTDAIVPDTFPDIARIVYAGGMVSVKDQAPQNDRILVSGSAAVTILYQPEGENGLRRLDVPLSFAHIEEGHGVGPDSVCFVRCSIAGMHARAVNSRKVSVTAELCFEVSAYQPQTLTCTEQIKDEEAPLEILYDIHDIPLLCAADTGSFTILDDLELGHADDLELLHTGCTLRPSECRAMKGRLVVRGECLLELLVRDDTNSLQQIVQTIPFTQMIDVANLAEGEPVTVRLAVQNVDAMLGSEGMLSIGVGVCALILRSEIHTLHTIRDLYQPRHELQIQARPIDVRTCSFSGSLAADGAETIPIGMPVTQYVDASAVCTGVRADPDGITLHLRTEISVLYLDADGNPYQIYRTLTVPVHASAPLQNALPQDLSLQVSAAPASEDSVNLRLTASGLLMRTGQEKIQDITSVEMSEEERPGFGDITLILRNTSEGEPLWDIAKQYATTVSAIRTANGLSEDRQTTGAQMLLIPVEA